MTSYSETRRQVLHVAMAVFALLLRYLTWEQAAGMAVAALAFNAFLLARVAPGIIRETDRRGARAGVVYYPLAVLLLILVFRTRLDIVAAAWGVMAFGDGFATLAGRALGGPRVPWHPDKHLSGLAAFIVAGAIGGVALGAWVAPAVTPDPAILFTIAAPVLAAIAAGLVETLPIRLDDNLTVPAAAGAVLWFLAQFTTSPPIGALAFDLAIGLAVSLPLAIAAWRTGSLTGGAALVGTLFAGVIYAGLYLAGLAVLAMALAFTLLSTRAGRARIEARGTAEPRERRAVGNIVANCLVGTAGAALALGSLDWGTELAPVWFVAGIAAGASDTVASEIGKAWGGPPRTFPTWRRAAPGTPGAVSVAGTIAGMMAALLMVAPAALLWLIPSTFVLPIVVACTAGAFVESALSTRFEADGLLDNNTLNFLNTAAAAALAVWWCAGISGRVA